MFRLICSSEVRKASWNTRKAIMYSRVDCVYRDVVLELSLRDRIELTMLKFSLLGPYLGTEDTFLTMQKIPVEVVPI